MPLLVCLALHAACTSTEFFTCEASSQCGSADAVGTCEVTGFCSFPDGDCESGQRYGDLAGPLSSTCVNPSGTGSGASSSGPGATTGSGTTAAPTTTPPSDGTSSSDATTSPISGSETGFASTTGAGESSSTGGPPSKTGPIGWWRLNDDPADGVLDASLNGNDGTCVDACPVANPEGFYTFDGTQVVTFPGTDFGAPTFTVALWVRPDPVTSEVDPIVFTRPAGDYVWNAWGLHYDNALSDFEFVIGNPEENTATVLDDPAMGGWHHYAGRFDGATATLFEDGLPTSSTAIPDGYFAIDEHNVYLGGDFDEGGPPSPRYSGDVDDVRYYDRPLSDAEIAALAALQR